MAVIDNLPSTGILSTDLPELVPEKSMRDGLDLRKLYDNDQLPKYDLLSRQASTRLSPSSRRRQIREELDLRSMSILKNNEIEFRKVQLELRKSGISTGMASLQMLDQKLTAALLEKRGQENAYCYSSDEDESMDQRVNKTIIKHRMTMIGSIPDCNNSAKEESTATRVMRRLSLTGSAPSPEYSSPNQEESTATRVMRRLSLTGSGPSPDAVTEPRPRRRQSMTHNLQNLQDKSPPRRRRKSIFG